MEVGALLVGVQRELAALREALTLPSIIGPGGSSAGPGGVNVSKLADVVERAEAGLAARAEELLASIMRNDVQTLPAIQPSRSGSREALRR